MPGHHTYKRKIDMVWKLYEFKLVSMMNCILYEHFICDRIIKREEDQELIGHQTIGYFSTQWKISS